MSSKMSAQIAICILLFPAGVSMAGNQTNQPKQISIAYEKANTRDMLRTIAKSLECKLSVDEKVDPSVTVLVRNVTWRTALDAICASIGCHSRVEGGTLTVSPLPAGELPDLVSRSTALKDGLNKRLGPRVRFEKVPLADALKDIFGSSRASYILLGETLSADRFVTIDVSNETVAGAVGKILENAGLKDFRIMQTVEDIPTYFVYMPPLQ